LQSVSKLTVDRLSVDRAGRRILSALSFECRCGAALIVRGPNGAGKSTLLRALAGLLPLEAGEIRLEHRSAVTSGGLFRPARHCHYIGHLDGVRPQLKVRETLAFWQSLAGRSEPAAVEAALDLMGLGALADLSGRYLSAGQKRRLGLSRLFVDQRPVWLLDEPMTSLDGQITGTLISLINDHLRSGGVAIVTSHLDLPLVNAREIFL